MAFQASLMRYPFSRYLEFASFKFFANPMSSSLFLTLFSISYVANLKLLVRLVVYFFGLKKESPYDPAALSPFSNLRLWKATRFVVIFSDVFLLIKFLDFSKVGDISLLPIGFILNISLF